MMMGHAKSMSCVRMIGNIIDSREMLFALAYRDLQSRYVGTLGGALWAFTHPLSVVIIFYFVFAVGFRAQGPADTPFILWFVCGLVPWFYFAETLTNITTTISNNRHLVKKTIFPTEILPFVHLISGMFPHMIFITILFGMLAFFYIPFMFSRVFVLYFLICNCALLIGIGSTLSALQVFYRDISQGLTIGLNLWFWITPIVWSKEIMPIKYYFLIYYNPFYYIVEGYRGMLIFDSIRWPGLWPTVYFWAVTSTALVLGTYVFGRLKPEFADVL
jgi:ABC-type polysaccharide/polyol phosphate export permease